MNDIAFAFNKADKFLAGGITISGKAYKFIKIEELEGENRLIPVFLCLQVGCIRSAHPLSCL
jgi:hypothetical protein